MPKSKRDKKISLTKTDKKGVALKQKLIEDVRNCVQKYNSIYVFTYHNMRTEKMQEVRRFWKPSRFFLGKNKVIALGLGRTPEEEVEDDLHKLAKCLKGNCGLFFTNNKESQMTEWFDRFALKDFARSGFKATETVKLKAGPLKQFAHSREPYLRKLGMPTKLDKGIVTLIKDFEVCKKGSILTPEQAVILKYLDHTMAAFHFKLRGLWMKGQGFKKLGKNENEGEEDKEKEQDEEEEEDQMDED